MTTLAQILGIESGVKSKTQREVTDLHRNTQKSVLFNGFEKTYAPLNEEGQGLPPESLTVQLRADEALGRLATILSRLVDVTYQKDVTNTQTTADVVVDGTTVVSGVPGPHLLFLVKTLDEIRTFVAKMPVLDPAVSWHWDENQGLWASEVIKTVRSVKEPTVLVRYEATDKHPAQTEVWQKDVPAGEWSLIKYSGAIPATRQQELLDRIDALQNAVKQALAKNNEAQVTAEKIAAGVFGYLFA